MQKLILNRNIKIIPNKSRNILYRVDDFFHSPDKITPLSPADSIFLLLFDGTRSKEDVAADFLRIFRNLKSVNVESVLNSLKERTGISDLLEDSSEYTAVEIERYGNRVDPLTLLIKREDFDMKGGDLRLDAPLSLNFNVATACPFSCLYCYHPLNEVKPFISLERLKVILREFKDNGCESVMLTGGDPMLRPDIDEVMAYLNEIGLFYTLSTKSVLSKERIDELVSRAGLDRIQISLDDSRSEVVEFLTGAGKGYFEACVRQIEYMQGKGIDVRVKSVLTSYNADNISSYLDFLNSLSIRHVQVVSYGRSGSRHDDRLFASRSQMENAGRAVEKARAKYGNMSIVGGGYSEAYANPVGRETPLFDKRAVCNAGRFAVTMLPNGEVSICEQLPYDKKYIIGDLNQQGLMDWWNSGRLQKWLSPPSRDIFPVSSPCRTCPEEDYNICHRRYSRCLRFCREYLGSTEREDVKCPNADYPPLRLT
jgi:MoaA/NifB/PqqE/SkfB family radical SAM enzyme